MLNINRFQMACLLALFAVAMNPGPPARAAEPNPSVEMTVANRGKIIIELYKKDAPKTAAHFQELAKRKFYDGILFHRVVSGFVAQAGDPASKSLSPQEVSAKDDHVGGTTGLGGGGSGANGTSAGIPFEANNKTHESGTISMALSGPRTATGDSQFFINLKPNHNLDGDYCVFGKVTKGMDVVQKIKRGDRITSIVPTAKTAKNVLR